MIASALLYVVLAQAPVITVDRDNIDITQSCTIKIARDAIEDTDNNGVIHIAADNITVDFAGATLHGAKPDQLPDSFGGTGITITGKNVALTNAKISGFKVGVLAQKADGLAIANTDVSGNFQQRLKSTPKAEDGSDWLWPHENDDKQWRSNYGAGICIEDCSNVALHDVTAHHGQNGIILDRVNDSKLYDCDCSFLSGWGLAMWRSNRNMISRNAFDFCVRGYSHGVYNRGQDSAGILMFEQCCDNVISENSVTHGGDGFFGFAGREAIGEVNQQDNRYWYEHRGNNQNKLVRNDFSFAPAHGIEMTFSFFNQMLENRLCGNAICGIWGGYSHETTIQGNLIENNGEMGYGAERGGIAIEHGAGNNIVSNSFRNNACGVRLWWNENANFANGSWGTVNKTASEDNAIFNNTFVDDRVAIELRNVGRTPVAGNSMSGVSVEIDADDVSRGAVARGQGATVAMQQASSVNLGKSRPVGARAALAGREHIIITEWGPYDWESPYLQRIDDPGPRPGPRSAANQHAYQLLGKNLKIDERAIHVDGEADAAADGDRIIVTPHQRGSITPYSVALTVNGTKVTQRDVLVDATWDIDVFGYKTDPRSDVDAWHKEASAGAIHLTAPALDLRYGMNGPSQLNLNEKVTSANLPKEHFGTIATTTLAFPAGKWRLKTTSDDGIRVWLDGKLMIDDWTHHGPTPHDYEFVADQSKTVEVRVEHFELDGFAVLSLNIEQIN